LKGKQNIEVICNQLENKLLEEFDEAEEDKDYDRMRVPIAFI
jgi:hypothetical protein